ncbi:MAG: hypothetical protein ACYCW6_21455 [Candidatus Xenobia bacterium]
MPFGDRSFKETLNTDIRELFAPRREPTASGARAQEAQLEIKASGESLDFVCLASGVRFFSLRGRLAGPLSVTAQADSRTPSVQVTIPVEVAGRTQTLQLTFKGERCDSKWPLQQATDAAFPDRTRVIDFIFGHDREQAIFSFSLPEQLPILNFQPVEQPQAPVFAAPPPVGQMATLLRAALKERSDTVSVLYDLSNAMGIGTLKLVNALKDRKVPIRSLPVDWLLEELERQGRRAEPQAVTAYCVLIDMEAGVITRADIEALGGGKPLPTSWDAIWHVATMLGVTMEVEPWRQRFEEAGLPSTEDEARLQIAARTLLRIEERQQRRDPMTVLAALAKETPSPRINEILELWKMHKTHAEPEVFDGFEAFCDLLHEAGNRTPRNTLLAMCLYVEIERGQLSGENFLRHVDSGQHLPIAPYTMEAVAEALDVELLMLTLPGRQVVDPGICSGLLHLAPQGMMLSAAGTPAFRFVRDRQALDRLLSEQPHLTGDVLFHPSVVGRLTERELDLLLDAGHTVHALYQSDLDRRRVWLRLTPQESRPGTFVSGFRTFRFNACVLGALGPRKGDESPVLARDTRGNLHYFRHQDELKPPLQMIDLALAPLTVAEVPAALWEMPASRHMGQDAAGAEIRRLDLLLRHLRPVVEREDRMKRVPLTSHLLKAIRSSIGQQRTLELLDQMVDPKTREQLVDLLNAEPCMLEFWLNARVAALAEAPEMAEVLALTLIYEMCVSPATDTFYRLFNRNWFRSTLVNQLVGVFESGTVEAREAACIMLGTRLFLGDKRERPILEYELNRMMEGGHPGVLTAAAESLCQLALSEVRPMPMLWEVRRLEKPAETGPASKDVAAQTSQLVTELKAWLSRANAILFGMAVSEAASTTPTRPGTRPAQPTSYAALASKGVFPLLLAARTALAEEGLENRFTWYLCSHHVIEELQRLTLASCKAWANASGGPLASLIGQNTAFANWQSFLRRAAVFAALRTPLADSWPEAVSAWRDAEVLGERPLWIHRQREDASWRTNRLFLEILYRAGDEGVERLELCRMRKGDGERPVVLDLEVLDAQTAAFVPLLEQMKKSVASDEDEAVLAWLTGVGSEAPGADDAARELAAEEQAEEEGERGAVLATVLREPMALAGQPAGWVELAMKFLAGFNLPESTLLQVLYIFRDADLPVLVVEGEAAAASSQS